MASFFDSSAALKLKPFSTSAAQIVKELSDRRVLEEDFLVDPAGYLATRLKPDAAKGISRERLSGANRFLFSLMSNEKFVAWTKEYQDQFLKNYQSDPFLAIDKEQIRLDLARAMVEHGDAEIIGAILPGNLRPGSDLANDILDRRILGADVVVEVEIAVYAVAAVAVFAVAVAAVLAGVARFGERAVVLEASVDVREMSSIAEALVRVGTQLRGRGQL